MHQRSPPLELLFVAAIAFVPAAAAAATTTTMSSNCKSN